MASRIGDSSSMSTIQWLDLHSSIVVAVTVLLIAWTCASVDACRIGDELLGGYMSISTNEVSSGKGAMIPKSTYTPLPSRPTIGEEHPSFDVAHRFILS